MRSVLLLLCAAVLLAGESKTPSFALAGKADAKLAFVQQEATAPRPQGGQPALVGCYLWGGRADQNYKPFFQWELRLLAGGDRLDALRLRLIPYDRTVKPLAAGEWKALGALAAGARLDCDVRLNCPSPAAFRIEAEWKGGSAVWIAGGKSGLPQPLPVDGGPLLVPVGGDEEYDARTRSASLQVSVWNPGRQAAQDAVATAIFRDAAGKELLRHDLPVGKGVVAAGAVVEARGRAQKVPEHASLAFATRCALATTTATGAEAAGGAQELALRSLVNEGSGKEARLVATVRNGTARALKRIELTLLLQDAAGRTLAELVAPVGDLAAGESRKLSLALPAKGAGWVGWETRWRMEE